MTKRSLMALGVLVFVATEFLVAAPKHPLDHLTAAEHWTAYEILRDSGQAESDMVILYVGLHEPPKSEVLAWRHGEDFRREAIVQLLQNNQGYEVILDLEAGSVLDWRDTPGQSYMRHSGDDEIVSRLLLADDDMKEAFTRRGVTDFSHIG